MTGSLEAWEGPPWVTWAVRYANQDAASGAQSLGVTVWLGGNVAAVPHLTAYVGVRGHRATLMADHLPRVDLLHHPDYLERYYGGREQQQATAWSNLQRTTSNGGGIRPFVSMDPTIRAVQSPNAIALSADLDDDEAIDTLRDTLVAHCERWLDFVRDNNKDMPSLASSTFDAASVAARDLALRRVLRNHERAAGERFMDAAQADALANSMVGIFHDDNGDVQ